MCFRHTFLDGMGKQRCFLSQPLKNQSIPTKKAPVSGGFRIISNKIDISECWPEQLPNVRLVRDKVNMKRSSFQLCGRIQLNLVHHRAHHKYLL